MPDVPGSAHSYNSKMNRNTKVLDFINCGGQHWTKSKTGADSVAIPSEGVGKGYVGTASPSIITMPFPLLAAHLASLEGFWHYTINMGVYVSVIQEQTMPDSDANVEEFCYSGSRAKSYKGETPLHEAAALSQSIRVQELLSAGTDPNAQANNGNTPLHLAASQGRAETVQTLLRYKADPNARANNNNTPLHMAALHGSEETVQTLLDAGSDPNAKAHNDRTPLHLASSQGHTETVRALLKAGSDPDDRDSSGNMPMALASNKGHWETRKVLETFQKTEDSGTADYVIESAGRDVATSGTGMESRQAAGTRAGHRLGLTRNIPHHEKEKHMPTLSIIGEPGSGKSHFATLLYIHMQTHPELNVYCDFENVEWNTISNADRLVRGIPLEPTPTDEMINDVLRVSWSETVKTGRGPFRGEKTSTKEIKIPIIDSAGELLQIAMGDILRTSGRISLRELEELIADRNYNAELVNTLFNEVFRADRFCFIVDAARGMNPRRGPSAQVKHSAFLQNLKNFREANKLPPILDSMLVFTKYDAAKSKIEEFLTRNGAANDGTTVANYQAPQLMSQLTSLQGGNGQDGRAVQVILSSTEWEKPPMTEVEIQDKYGNRLSEDEKMEHREGLFNIKLLGNGKPVPIYNEEEYEKIVNWLKAML